MLAAFLKAIGCIIPLMDAMYASYYTKEVMVVLVREFQTPDEEMKKIVLKVIPRCFAMLVTTDIWVNLHPMPVIIDSISFNFIRIVLQNALKMLEQHKCEDLCFLLFGLYLLSGVYKHCASLTPGVNQRRYLRGGMLCCCAGGAAVRGDGGSGADLCARRDPAGVLPQLLGAPHGARPPQLPRARRDHR